MKVGINRRNPRKPSSPQKRGWFEQMHAADFMVTVRRESRQNQVSFVSKEKHHITVWRQVDAGAEFQLCHVGRLPNLLAGARLKADQFAVGFGRVNVVSPQEGS